MRTKVDALRSLQKYAAQVLAPNPELWAISFSGVTWTTQARVQGAFNVDAEAWRWLKARDRHPNVAVGAQDAPQSYYLASELAGDPAADATTAGITLPTGGATVAEFALETQPRWEVRTWYDRDEIPEDRPYARVDFVGAGPTTGPALYYEVTQPFAIECQPLRGGTVKESKLIATQLEDVLLNGFRGAGVQLGRPRRIPMWDFDGIGPDETSSERVAADYMRLLDFSTRQLADPSDASRIGVFCDLRLNWRVDVPLKQLHDRVGGTVQGTRTVGQVIVEVDGQ